MENTTNKADQNGVSDKKEMRKQLTDKLAAVLPELRDTLGEEKFHHRIKKAVKLLTEGLHKKEAAETIKKAKAATKAASGKKAAAKKAKAVKKTPGA